MPKTSPIPAEKLEALRKATARRAAAALLQGMAVREVDYEFVAKRIDTDISDIRNALIDLVDGNCGINGLRALSDILLALELELNFGSCDYQDHSLSQGEQQQKADAQ